MKLGTPCARMHAANSTGTASGLEPPEVVELLDVPHAAIASAHQVTAGAITRWWRARCLVSLGVSRTS
ncbi:MAG TPA: hypothetical protein VEF89_01765 [Solirubrobacteraceae bacterium]|nr:hypothetical protein [Solirubrobacteraceae bacterium]